MSPGDPPGSRQGTPLDALHPAGTSRRSIRFHVGTRGLIGPPALLTVLPLLRGEREERPLDEVRPEPTKDLVLGVEPHLEKDESIVRVIGGHLGGNGKCDIWGKWEV